MEGGEGNESSVIEGLRESTHIHSKQQTSEGVFGRTRLGREAVSCLLMDGQDGYVFAIGGANETPRSMSAAARIARKSSETCARSGLI